MRAHDISANTSNDVCMVETLQMSDFFYRILTFQSPIALYLLACKHNPLAANFFNHGGCGVPQYTRRDEQSVNQIEFIRAELGMLTTT
jgi:hypothetical protein